MAAINISIYECLTTPATTTNAIKRAVFSTYSRAVMNGAEAIALASGHTCYIEIEWADRSIERIWVYSMAAPAMVATAGAFGNLKPRKAQPGYSIFTGTREDVITAARQHPGARARANGAAGCWLLILPTETTARAVAA